MRILIRTSKTAIWARRLASFALPLAVIPVLLHLRQIIDANSFELVELVALGFALLAFVLSVLAMVRLWYSGDRGWDRASAGLALSLVCLAPFAYGGFEIYRNPAVTDVATAAAEQLPLLEAPASMSSDPAVIAAIQTRFPNVQTRHYQQDATRIFGLIEKLVKDRNWDVQLDQPPTGEVGSGRINAIVTTWLGWRDEVAIRLASNSDGADVDMRSASIGGGYSDMGANGARIEDFLLALDAAVTEDMENGDIDTTTPPPRQESQDPNFVYPRDLPPGLRP